METPPGRESILSNICKAFTLLLTKIIAGPWLAVQVFAPRVTLVSHWTWAGFQDPFLQLLIFFVNLSLKCNLKKSQVGEGRACWSLGNAHSAMGETESAYHYASRSFSRLGEISVKTYVIFDLLDILTLQERLEIGWGKPQLRSNENTIKCRFVTSPKIKLIFYRVVFLTVPPNFKY